MRYLLISVLCFILLSCEFESKKSEMTFADNPVIAHRGAWKAKDLPQNSIAALKEAIRLNCTGSEFDVRMTSDEILIVTHDGDYEGLDIEASTYQDLAKQKLPNGETLPTLKDYIVAGMTNNSSTGLVCEIKPSKIEGRNVLMADKAVALVKELNAEDYISYYISFSYEVIKRIKEIDTTTRVLYLDGSKSPQELKRDNITGLDYLVYKLKMKPHWITEAKELGLKLNAWTANKEEDIDWLLANDFDYITTDEPELAFQKIETSPTKDNYKLVWSDEFNYNGQPDTTKWTHELGFVRNNEKQYYTDSLKNARVEKGHLIIETHNEIIENKTFKNLESQDWTKNQPSANYTSASISTENLAEWTYGRIDIRAKLPQGRGLWPAFWMLGSDFRDVGWPDSGEIDIMEHVGFNNDSIFGTVHTKSYNHMNGTQKGKHININDPYNSYHIYTLLWTPTELKFALDDKVFNEFSNENKSRDEWPFDRNFFLKINTAVGGMLGGRKGIDDAIFPQQMIIDYVRVFQKEEEL